MNTAQTPSSLDRWSGACWVAAGLLLLIGMFHPELRPPLSDPGDVLALVLSDCGRLSGHPA